MPRGREHIFVFSSAFRDIFERGGGGDHTVLSVWNKPLIETCQYCSTSRANQALRSLANAGFQNRGVCLQAFPSFPSPSPHFHFLALVSFLAQPKPRIPFLGLSLLRNQTETLATQAKISQEAFFRFSIYLSVISPTNVKKVVLGLLVCSFSLQIIFFSEQPF